MYRKEEYHATQVPCPRCGRHLSYVKITTYSPDFDWSLRVECPTCGQIHDPRTDRDIRRVYDERWGQAWAAAQLARLAQIAPGLGEAFG